MSSLLSVYHRLPGPLREAAATTRGYYLRSWRYGRETEALVRQALEREHWGADDWARWRTERLAFLLRRAASDVPFYRDLWQRRRRAGNQASVEYLENWPVLAKEAVRARPRAFVADDCNPARMFPEHTSGTTGTPLNLWQTRSTVRAWYAVVEARLRRWNGVSRRDRWAVFGGQLVIPASQSRPPFWVWNAGLRQLYLSAYHLSPATIGAYADVLRDYRVQYALGYPSALHAVAVLAREAGIPLPQLRVTIGNAEPVLATQREEIAKGFGCPMRETYGMAEVVAAASDCGHGRLHTWPEVGLVEVLEDASDAAAAGIGRLVCTGLINADMPLIRYAVGDRGRLAPAGAQVCGCGRTLPILEEIDGRSDDVVVTPDGRRIGRFDPVFKADFPIREAQIVQEAPDRLLVRVVPAAGFSERTAAELAERLRMRTGSAMTISVEQVKLIPRTAAGKFRAVIGLAAATRTRSGP